MADQVADAEVDLARAHRRPARRARAGHHDRRRVPLLRDAASARSSSPTPRATSATRATWSPALDRRPRRRAGRRAQRRARAVAPPRVPLGAARHQAHGRVREQDGPRRLGRGPLPRDRARLRAMLGAQLGVADALAIPVSALHGDNVVEPSREHAVVRRAAAARATSRQVEVARDRNLDDVRFPVQWVVRDDRLPRLRRPDGERACCAPATRSWCSRAASARRSTGSTRSTGPVEARVPADVGGRPPRRRPRRRPRQHDLRRRRPAAGRAPARRAVCWMADAPLRAGARYQLKHTTRRVRATRRVDRRARWTSSSCATAARRPSSSSTTSAACTCDLAAPVMAEPYTRNRVTGAFILVDEATHDTVAAGMVLGAHEDPGPPTGPHSPGVIWHEPALPRRERWSVLGLRGATVWLTGLPASGKSTIAEELERALVGARPPGLPARRRERPPRAQRRPRLLPRRPLRARPPRRQRRAHVRRRRRWSRSSRSSPPPPPTARPRASCTRRRASTSSRRGWTRRSRSASGATRTASTRAPAPASCPASPASTRRTRRPRRPTCALRGAEETVERSVQRIVDALETKN